MAYLAKDIIIENARKPMATNFRYPPPRTVKELIFRGKITLLNKTKKAVEIMLWIVKCCSRTVGYANTQKEHFIIPTNIPFIEI